jgi:NAD(P)-dependent dehydrogenase (short-subunit alcohol dehydrogenase family)
MDSMWSDQARTSMAEPTMLGRLGRPEEIAGPIAFLLSRAA